MTAPTVERFARFLDDTYGRKLVHGTYAQCALFLERLHYERRRGRYVDKDRYHELAAACGLAVETETALERLWNRVTPWPYLLGGKPLPPEPKVIRPYEVRAWQS